MPLKSTRFRSSSYLPISNNRLIQPKSRLTTKSFALIFTASLFIYYYTRTTQLAFPSLELKLLTQAPPIPTADLHIPSAKPASILAALPPLPPTVAPPPTPPRPTKAVFRTAAEIDALPLADLTEFVPPVKPLPPTLTFPFFSFDKAGANWLGRQWFTELSTYKSVDPPFLSPPPAAYLKAAFDYQARQIPPTSSRIASSFNIKYNPTDGRPLLPIITPKSSSYQSPIDILSSSSTQKALPTVQVEPEMSEESLKVQQARQDFVKQGFLHSWEGYKKVAWGHDEVKPVSGGFSDGYNGWGATIFDSMTTLLVMNLSHEYNLAREHVKTVDFSYLLSSDGKAYSSKLPPLSKLQPPVNPADWKVGPPPNLGQSPLGSTNYYSPTTIPTFETIIRYLGATISAYDLSGGDPLMLARAIELGDWLVPALNTKHGLPLGRYAFGDDPHSAAEGRCTLSEVGSFSLEFTRLSQISGDSKYFLLAERAMKVLDNLEGSGQCGTLLPTQIDPDRPKIGGQITFGALTDSFIEYQLKSAQLISNADPMYSRMYHRSIHSAVECKLIRDVEVVPGHPELITVGSITSNIYRAELQHLSCFAGGMLALGSKLLGRKDDLRLAAGITNACYFGSVSTPSGVMAEIITFFRAGDPSQYRARESKGKLEKFPVGYPTVGLLSAVQHSQGRPEAIESIFYMYRITGDRKWQDKGWELFVAWQENCFAKYGMAGLKSVYYEGSDLAVNHADSQESFVLAETFKYYYLLFAPHDLISLDDFVFNTEAHPFSLKPNRPVGSPAKWTGPELESSKSKSFSSGSLVQQWGRISQAAALGHTVPFSLRKTLPQAHLITTTKIELEKEVSPKGNFIRPSEKELAAALAREKTEKGRN